ncbi:MAG: thermonuclease family protein [Alphaproteobacteria bacterium]|nr:thermonuclease family protein [Alphaproteobacteria bacterium]USO07470.1 MAG: thermonuclease family protein [Rhodospirillales bacterium]
MIVRLWVWIIIAVLALACPWGRGAFAQDAPNGGFDTELSADSGAKTGPLMPKIMGDFRRFRMTVPKARVTDVLDGVTIETDNKTKVRLTGIWVPWESADDPGETVRRAAALLKKVAQGRYVRLYQTKDGNVGRTNRMGQTLAQVERDDGMWLQGILLYEGLASVMTSESNPEMAPRMYEVEADARRRRAGLWGDDRWRVLAPDEAKDYVNEYRIVEGKVYSTALRDNTFFINFGRDWRTDFTVAVPSTKRLEFAREGVNLMGLNGKALRVRGFIRNVNGALIEISHPEQIEVLEDHG